MLGRRGWAGRLLAGAWEAFRQSKGQMVEIEAQIADFEAALLLDEGQTGRAQALLERARLIYTGAEDPEAEDPHLLAQTLAHQAFCLEHSSQPEPALELLGQAAARLDPKRDPRLLLLILRRAILLLLGLARPAEAQPLLPRARHLARRHGTPRDRLRLRHAEGRLAAALEQPQAAEQAYRRAVRGFLTVDEGLDAALGMLDLAVLYAGQGAADAMAGVARELLPLAQSPAIDPGALGVLVEFRQACDEQRFNPALAAELRDSLIGKRPCEW
ncbi:MAG TPA: hypothetical protein VHR45_21680 [Thermoanaerobaculia bacterium]|nr:hypothetical protein [Thermoanaerobaculia bacterium]